MGGDKQHDKSSHGHSDHGHADDGHGDHGHGDHGHGDHGHGGHGGEELLRDPGVLHAERISHLPYDDHSRIRNLNKFMSKGPHEAIPLPPMGSAELDNSMPMMDPKKPMPPPRSVWDRFADSTFLSQYDPALPHYGHGLIHQAQQSRGSFWGRLFKSYVPLRDKDHSDAYIRGGHIPEETFEMVWRVPLMQEMNPKIPPPKNGQYNDYYHYLAFKNWFTKEHDVYSQECNLLQWALAMCIIREPTFATNKNCKHLGYKLYAMGRREELNVALMYMAMTGEGIIRETPYPPDFVDQKRKIYDDWLFRTRMRKPGDTF